MRIKLGVILLMIAAPAVGVSQPPPPPLPSGSSEDSSGVLVDVMMVETRHPLIIDAGSVTITSQPALGVAFVGTDVGFEYIPFENVTEFDSFTFEATTAIGIVLGRVVVDVANDVYRVHYKSNMQVPYGELTLDHAVGAVSGSVTRSSDGLSVTFGALNAGELSFVSDNMPTIHLWRGVKDATDIVLVTEQYAEESVAVLLGQINVPAQSKSFWPFDIPDQVWGCLAGGAAGAAGGGAVGAAGGPLAPITVTGGAIIGGVLGCVGGAGVVHVTDPDPEVDNTVHAILVGGTTGFIAGAGPVYLISLWPVAGGATATEVAQAAQTARLLKWLAKKFGPGGPPGF